MSETGLTDLLNAGGLPALAGALVYAARYLAARLDASQAATARSHQEVVAILQGVVRENTSALVRVEHAIGLCHRRHTPAQVQEHGNPGLAPALEARP